MRRIERLAELLFGRTALRSAVGAVVLTLILVGVAAAANAHEWDRPRDLQPVELVVPAILPADAPEGIHVHWFLSELEWVNRGAHIPQIPEHRAGVPQGNGSGIPLLSASTVSPGVEQWRSLVAAYFGPNTDAALSVMACESGGNPNAQHPGSKASGLFQFLPNWYLGVWNSPFGVFDPFHPETNIAAAAWLSQGGSSWTHWVCKP